VQPAPQRLTVAEQAAERSTPPWPTLLLRRLGGEESAHVLPLIRLDHRSAGIGLKLAMTCLLGR